MNVFITRALVATSIILLPGGVALARQGSDSHLPVLNGQIAIQEHVSEIRTGGRTHAEDNFVNATTGTSTHHGGYWSNPDNAEDVRGSAGEIKEGHDRATSSTTTSRERHGGDNGNRGPRGGVSIFLGWFLGLPDATTVGDIKAQINGSTTPASTSPIHDNQGMGLFARLFSFFRFRGEQDN